VSDCMSWLGVDPHKRMPLPVPVPHKEIKGKPWIYTLPLSLPSPSYTPFHPTTTTYRPLCPQ